MTSPQALEMLVSVDAEHPGLLRYMQVFAAYVGLPFDVMTDRMAAGLRKLGPARLAAACVALEAVGVLPDVVVETEAQVQVAWESAVLQTCLRYGVRFYPPLDTDIRRVLPPPCEDLFRIVAERPAIADPYAPYWQQQLAATLPELYLLPYLGEVRARHGPSLVGADLACGWGRVCLSMRDYTDLKIHGCDLSRRGLRVLRRLVRNAGLQDHVIPTRADVSDLPFADASIHFFTVFDILEHLSDPMFDRVMREILRCAAVGAVVYAEIPLQSKSPSITHVQDFRFTPLVQRIHGFEVDGRRYELRNSHPLLLHHMTFAVFDRGNS